MTSAFDHQIKSAVAALVPDAAPYTDLDAVARRVEVTSIEARDDLAFSGALERTEGGLRIVYAAENDFLSSRETIAHELAHAYLLTRAGALRPPAEEVEWFCDRFAAELLLPTERLLQFGSHRSELTLAVLRDCATEFCLPLKTAASRWAAVFGVGVALAEVRELLWAVGPIREFEEPVRDTVRHALFSRNSVFEALRPSGTSQAWTIEVEPLADLQALVLLRDATTAPRKPARPPSAGRRPLRTRN